MYKGVMNAIRIERECLDENLNTMYFTDSKEELQDMFGIAINRVLTLRNLNMQRLKEVEIFKES